jgi:2-oxoglutarate ferredoxin oxidoreductase subunit delta
MTERSKPKPTISINQNWCKGCYLCVSVCPRDVLEIDGARWIQSHHPVVVRRADRCTACRNCELLCPDLAIAVEDAEVTEGT